jgi:hypothetical protein
MIRRILLTAIMSVIALFGVVVGATPAAACDTACEHSAHFWNYQSYTPILMCKDWTTAYGDGYWPAGTCKHISDGGQKRYLYRGYQTNITFGWHDTDGYYVKAYHNVAVRRTENVLNSWVKVRSTGWHKHSGCGECVWEIKQYHT